MSELLNVQFKNLNFSTNYREKLPKFEKMRKNAHSIVEDILLEEGIPFLQVQSRVKSPESALGKISKKSYEDPFRQITDFVGLRAIVYLESDVDRAAKALSETFSIDKENSVDKRIPDSPNIMGYRSLHLICHLGKSREVHKEYHGICDLPFEVQIRTALTHTWAEIEHKQNYKSSQALPKRLQRRLNLIAATLESVDLQLDNLNKDSQNYINDLANEEDTEINKDELSDTSLEVVSKSAAKSHNIELSAPESVSYKSILQDLANFDVNTVGDLRKFLKKFPGNKLKEDQKKDTVSGYLSLAMASNDLTKYIAILKEKDRPIYKHRVAKYENVTGKKNLEDMLNSAGVKIIEKPAFYSELLKGGLFESLFQGWHNEEDEEKT